MQETNEGTWTEHFDEVINDRLERIGSSMAYNIVAEGGHEAYEKLVLKIPTPKNDLMERGLRLELPMMEWAAHDNGWEFTKAGTARWEEDGVPFRDTPDFWIHTKNDTILGEVKTHNTFIRDDYGEEYTDAVPDRQYVQAQFHMGSPQSRSRGITETRIPASFGGEKPEIFIVPFEPAAANNIYKLCIKFWKEHVETKTPPASNATKSCTNVLKRMPISSDDMLPASKDHTEKHGRLLVLKKEIALRETELVGIQNWFRSEIGENVGIQNDAVRYTWKRNKSKLVIDYKALVRELDPDPELIAKHTEEVQGARVLRGKTLKAKKVK